MAPMFVQDWHLGNIDIVKQEQKHFSPFVSTTVRPLAVTSCVEPERAREVFLLRRLRDGSHPTLVIQVVLPRGPGPT